MKLEGSVRNAGTHWCSVHQLSFIMLELVCSCYELSAAPSRRMELLQLPWAELTPAVAAILPSEEEAEEAEAAEEAEEEEEVSWGK